MIRIQWKLPLYWKCLTFQVGDGHMDVHSIIFVPLYNKIRIKQK